MTIKQLSIFIENKGGTLIQVLELLSQAGIQIIASTVADTMDYSVVVSLADNLGYFGVAFSSSLVYDGIRESAALVEICGHFGGATVNGREHLVTVECLTSYE